MNTRIIGLVCLLTASACGRGDNNLDQDSNTVANTLQREMDRPLPAPMNGRKPGTTSSLTTSTAPLSIVSARVEAPPAPSEVKTPDNPTTSVGKGHGSTLTPTEQGNSSAEKRISTDVRHAIEGDDSLTFTAQNVKITTIGTKVTLRGPVKTAQEKTAIEALTKRTAGVTSVDNQLAVVK